LRDVARDEVGEREVWRGELALGLQPAFDQRAIQTVLAPEVVGDQLLVDACPRGDLAHPRARAPLAGELDQRGVQQRTPGAFRVALALLGGGRAPGPRSAWSGHTRNLSTSIL
jgi:hypothetical protein